MILTRIGLIAADTSRSYSYINELINNQIFPNFVLVLKSFSTNLKPGQEKSKSIDSLVNYLSDLNIEIKVLFNDDINSKQVIKNILNREESVFIYSGFGGYILNDTLIKSNKKFLHVHGGYLPHYRGSTTNYYSLIKENFLGASSLFLTSKIDDGHILIREKFLPPQDRNDIDHNYDSKIRAIVLIKTLKKYIELSSWDFGIEDNEKGEYYYIIHPVLKHLAIIGTKSFS